MWEDWTSLRNQITTTWGSFSQTSSTGMAMSLITSTTGSASLSWVFFSSTGISSMLFLCTSTVKCLCHAVLGLFVSVCVCETCSVLRSLLSLSADTYRPHPHRHTPAEQQRQSTTADQKPGESGAQINSWQVSISTSPASRKYITHLDHPRWSYLIRLHCSLDESRMYLTHSWPGTTYSL